MGRLRSTWRGTQRAGALASPMPAAVESQVMKGQKMWFLSKIRYGYGHKGD